MRYTDVIKKKIYIPIPNFENRFAIEIAVEYTAFYRIEDTTKDENDQPVKNYYDCEFDRISASIIHPWDNEK